MNAHFFDTSSQTCPVCHRSGAIKPHKLIKGLLTCQHCRERLVVSCSGHYVRDPFALQQLNQGQLLRQQSHPLARFWRDFTFSSQPFFLATIGSTLLIGFALVFYQAGLPQQNGSIAQPKQTVDLDRQ
jgi:hypothetical protein